LTAWLPDSAVFRVPHPHFLFDADLVDCSLGKKARMTKKDLTPRPARNASRSSSHFGTRIVLRSDAGGRKAAKERQSKE
jgi:hypothetical protein